MGVNQVHISSFVVYTKRVKKSIIEDSQEQYLHYKYIVFIFAIHNQTNYGTDNNDIQSR